MVGEILELREGIVHYEKCLVYRSYCYYLQWKYKGEYIEHLEEQDDDGDEEELDEENEEQNGNEEESNSTSESDE